MNPVARTLIVALLTFASGLLGFFLQWLLPVQDVAGAKDMIGSIIGFVTLLLALVLGTLLGSAHAFFARQKADLESLAARSLELDLAFQLYGPETQPLREALRASVREAYDALQGNGAAYRSISDVDPDVY